MKRRELEVKAEWMASNMEARRQRRRAALAKERKKWECLSENRFDALKDLMRPEPV